MRARKGGPGSQPGRGRTVQQPPPPHGRGRARGPAASHKLRTASPLVDRRLEPGGFPSIPFGLIACHARCISSGARREYIGGNHDEKDHLDDVDRLTASSRDRTASSTGTWSMTSCTPTSTSSSARWAPS